MKRSEHRWGCIPFGSNVEREWLAPDGFNVFLISLAHNTHGRTVTIILSGMAQGSAALKELRINGGLTFAEADAAVSSMPTSAVTTGKVDYFCSAAEIGVLVSALPPVSPP